jgi:DNA-binding transcriptional ArsR family regulator
VENPYTEITALDELDPIVSERSRLKILTILRRTDGSDYLFIQRLTGLSMANLSNHLAKLEEAGLVDLYKHFVGKKPVTSVRLTPEGRDSIEAFWDQMKRIESQSRQRTLEMGTPDVGFGGTAYGGAPGV